MPTELNTDERTCPHCAETIKAAAKICRFCNRDVTTPSAVSAADKPAQTGQKQQNVWNTPLNGGVSAAIAIIFLLWIGNSVLSGAKQAEMESATYSSDSIGTTPSVSLSSMPEIAAAEAAAAAVSNNVDLQPKKIKSLAQGKFGQPVLAGEVVNTSGKTLRYLEANAEFTDKKGTIVATGMDNSGDTLAPGQTWRFEVMWPQAASNASGNIVSVKGTYQ